MTDRAPEPEDPRRTTRLVVGTTAGLLMVLSVLFRGAVYGLPDGGHTALLRGLDAYGARELIIALVGLAALWFVWRPTRIDARVAQSAMLAAGIVAVAVGFVVFVGAIQARGTPGIAGAWPGVAAWAQVIAAVLFLYLRWDRTLWPESRWMRELMPHARRRR